MAPISCEKETSLSGARALRADDLEELCSLDEQSLRARIAREVSRGKTRVALIPDLKTMQWHHAREEFAGREMLGREPDVKGAHADCRDGSRVWCIWTRTFGSTEAGNTLNILRFFIEGEEDAVRENPGIKDDLTDLESTDQAKVHGAAAVLHAAQIEAARWGMKDVQIWNRKLSFLSNTLLSLTTFGVARLVLRVEELLGLVSLLQIHPERGILTPKSFSIALDCQSGSSTRAIDGDYTPER